MATNCPEWAVTEDWPKVYSALLTWGIADYDTSRAVLATIAIETAHTFKPVQEAFWLDDAWRYANLRYAPYWGRGYVQLTWLENYTYYGWKIGHPELATFPDKAMVPDHSCTAIGCVLQLRRAYSTQHNSKTGQSADDWCRVPTLACLNSYRWSTS
jgi:hypothetical protein